MSGRARSRSSGVRRTLSVLLMSSLLSLSAGPLAATLGRGEDHRCACCPKGACKCCRRSDAPAGGPTISSRYKNCGCAGMPAGPRVSLDAPEPARELTVLFAAANHSCEPLSSPTGRTPDPRHQRPPPSFPS